MAWTCVAGLAYLIARSNADEYSMKRQRKVRDLLDAVAAQARELARPKK
jgi:hypothetical protein